VFEKDFASDSLGQQLLKADTISFRGKSKRDYGKLILRFRNLDLTKNPVLLFILNNEIKKSYPLNDASFSQQLFLPGEYHLRILNDKNKNGVWDPGVFFGEHQQPELVKPLQRTINVRPNFDTGTTTCKKPGPAKQAEFDKTTQVLSKPFVAFFSFHCRMI
jgi:hypothetical protein